jgi:uncharacterized protein (TIGR02145 family)
MKNIVLIIAIVVFESGLNAQVRQSNGNALGAASNSSAFFDASSTPTWNSSTNIGKGMIFPRVDLSLFTSFSFTGSIVPSNYPSRFDGFVVYNTKVGGVAGVGVTEGTLTRGFWYYDNDATTVNGGTWRPLNTGSQGITGLLPNGTIVGNTAFWDGTQWVVDNDNLINNGANVGIGTTNPTSSAKLEIASTTQGFLPPRMTSAQRDAIANPVNGLTVFNTTTGCQNFYSNNNWYELCGSIVVPPGSLTALNCAQVSRFGTLIENQLASGVSFALPYQGGNGGTYTAQTINSTGVTGIIATLNAGTLASGNGNLVFTISGTPSAIGNASFVVNFGNESCTITMQVFATPLTLYPSGSVFCSAGPTVVVEVTNPSTGKIWMDRNLGATQVALSSTDANSYGDLYQWGRRSDGHQCRTSGIVSTLSSTDQPTTDKFINTLVVPFDWRSPENSNLWQGVNGINNPCPTGYRLPTKAELTAEMQSWNTANAAGAFASPLKFPMAGYRIFADGSADLVGFGACYSSSTPDYQAAEGIYVNGNSATNNTFSRADGLSVRCIKD